MKNCRNVFRLLLLVLFVAISGCAVEDLEDNAAQGGHNHDLLQLKEVQYSELLNMPKFKILHDNVLKSNDNRNGFSIENSNNNGFTIVNTQAKVIETDSIISYTLLVEKSGSLSNSFDNLVIQTDINGNYPRAFLLNYTPTEMLPSSDDSFTFSGNIKREDLQFAGVPPMVTESGECTIEVVWCHYQKDHVAGKNCTNSRNLYIVTTVVDCPDTGGAPGGPGAPGAPGGSGPGGLSGSGPGSFLIGGWGGLFTGGWGSGPTGNGNPNGGNITANPITSPIKLSKQERDQKNAQAFYDVLLPDEKQWADDNPNEYNEIIAFLIDSNWTDVSKLYAKQMLQSMINNDGYSGDGFKGDNDDDNVSYTGPKQLIPQQIVLSDGSLITVTFGTTASDNVNANKQVAVDLVNCIKFSLEEANLNLTPTDKITSIYIMATTNGDHSSTSNHSRGTAVDISRINGVKMINSSTSTQVLALQNAFDSYQNIRENFGPFFKHKTFPNGSVNLNWPIGGHKDHIHISVQSN